VAEVDDLHPGALQDAPEDIDRGVVPVKERCGCDDADAVLGLVYIYGSGHIPSLHPPWRGVAGQRPSEAGDLPFLV
jgi:hypothetical protein